MSSRHGLVGLLPALVLVTALPADAAEGRGPPRYVTRAEVPAAVEAELATREVVCRLGEEGALVIPKDTLGEADLNGDGKSDYVITLCKIGCEKTLPPPGQYCDQSLLFVSSGGAYQPIKMPGELLDIRRDPGQPIRLLSSSISDHVKCPVADRVCNPIYVVRGGQIMQEGME